MPSVAIRTSPSIAVNEEWEHRNNLLPLRFGKHSRWYWQYATDHYWCSASGHARSIPTVIWLENHQKVFGTIVDGKSMFINKTIQCLSKTSHAVTEQWRVAIEPFCVRATRVKSKGWGEVAVDKLALITSELRAGTSTGLVRAGRIVFERSIQKGWSWMIG